MAIEQLAKKHPVFPVSPSSKRKTKQRRKLRLRAWLYHVCSQHHTLVTVLGIAILISLAMLVGILIVCFTAPEKSNHTCVLKVESITQISLTNNSHPKSLIIYDFNNDSILDIAVASYGTDNIGILFGKGNGSFATQTKYSTGTDSQPSSIALGDFNRDHHIDIVVANYGTHTIGLFFGNGDGIFTNQTTFYTGSSRPLWVTVGDFDNDSQSDIVVVNNGTNTIDIFFGYDHQNFTKHVELSTGYDSIPLSAIVDDFNNDNHLDIAIANSGTHTISIFVGNGNGTFPIQLLTFTGITSQPNAIVAADLNNDNQLDIVVANSIMDNICILYGYGNGTFFLEGTYSTGSNSNPISVITGDFDNDNQLDIAVCNSGTDAVGIFLDQNFEYEQVYSTGLSSNPYFITSADINKDGRHDIIVANYETNIVDILLADVDVRFSNQINYTATLKSALLSVDVGDFNNDSLIDIVVIYTNNSNIGLSFGNGDGTFSTEQMYSTGVQTYPLSIDVGDFNNDTIVDIVIGCFANNSGQIKILFGNHSEIFSNIITTNIDIGSYPISIAVADFNNDHRLDIVIISYEDLYTNQGTIGVLLGNGNGTFSDHMTFVFHSSLSPQSIAIGDFNNDSRLDFAIANRLNNISLSSSIGIFLGYGNGSFSNQRTFSTGYYALTQSISVGDFNDDHRLDIVVSNPWNINIGVFLGYGNGSFSSQKTYSTGIASNPIFVSVFYFNNDSQLDILVVNNGIGSLTIFLGDGEANFKNILSYSTGNDSLPLSVALADFNRDSLMDIVIINNGYNNLGIMLSAANVSFARQTPVPLGSSPGPHYVVVNDFNNDNRVDIAVVNYITNNIGVFAGDADLTYSLQFQYPTGPFSSPTSIAVADFNYDTYLDIVVSNSGKDSIGLFFGNTNGFFQNQITYLLAENSNSQSVAAGDFNNDSRPDIIVANLGNDNISVLINSYGGSFSQEVRYYTGYGSHPTAMAIGDLNNDRILDIVVVNNYYGSLQFMFGDGYGHFSNQSTYFIGYETYPVGVALGDFNNDTYIDIVIVRNVVHLIVILLQNQNGSFIRGESYNTGDDSWPTMAIVDDYNNDNRLDIVVGNSKTNNVYIFIGIGNGSFIYNGKYQTGNESGLTSVAKGDINNDNRLDIIISSTWKDYINILLGNGDGTFSQQIIYFLPVNSFPASISVGDIDNDNNVDIVVANEGDNNIVILFGYGNGSFSNEIILSTGVDSQPVSIALGDYNNDNRVDIGVVNSQSGSVYLFFGYINRTFSKPVILLTDDRFLLPIGIANGHFNNDTLLDIAVCNQYSEHIGIFLGIQQNTFLMMPPYSTGINSQPTYVVVNDFNNDNILDIAVANSGSDNIMILFGSGYGTFLDEINYSTGDHSQPHYIAVADLNNDNVVDLVVANSGAANIGILLGYNNGTFSKQMTYSTDLESRPLSIIIANYNDNTLSDIVVANYGSNTILFYLDYENGSFQRKISYTIGFNAHPIALASGDVSENNTNSIIFANAGYGNVQVILKLCQDNVN